MVVFGGCTAPPSGGEETVTEYHEDILKTVFKAGREPTKVTGTCWCPQQRRAHKAPLSAPGTPSPVPEPHVLTEALLPLPGRPWVPALWILWAQRFLSDVLHLPWVQLRALAPLPSSPQRSQKLRL